MSGPEYARIAPDVQLGRDVKLFGFVNLYGCKIGDETKIGAFVEIQKNAVIGRRCKISSHSFICEGVTIEDECFIGHGVMFINDKYPRATRPDGQLATDADWSPIPTRVGRGASIGSGAVILCGVTIGTGALVGAGAVVTHDVPPGAVVAGVPARALARVTHSPKRISPPRISPEADAPGVAAGDSPRRADLRSASAGPAPR